MAKDFAGNEIGSAAPPDSVLDRAFAEDPAPAAAPTAEPSPAAVAPAEVPGQPPVPVAPVAEGTPPTPVVAAPAPEDPQKAYMDQLRQQNQQLTQSVQELALQSRALLEKQLKESQPELTPAQRQEKIAAAFERLNADPEAYIQELVQAKLDDRTNELEARFAAKDPKAEVQREIDRNLDGLWKNAAGTEVRPELAKKEFRDLMVSAPVAKAVYDRLYPGQDPSVVARDPQFFVELFHEARSRATAQFAPTQAQAQADAATQTAVAAAHSAQPDGRLPAGSAPKVDQDKAFIEEMKAQRSPTDVLLDLMAKK